MKKLVSPHGGVLKPLMAAKEKIADELKRAESLKKVEMTSKEASDLVMLATGSFSPLEGFMTKADYEGVVNGMEMASGVLWPIPVTLACDASTAEGISEGEDVALTAPETGEIMGVMTVQEKFSYDKKVEAEKVFGTTDEEHPGVKRIYTQGDTYLGGKVVALSEGGYPERFPEFARPAETRAIFEENGWGSVAAFQTRNPMHRSHEYLAKIAMEVCDGLFIHPIVGALKAGDIPADVRMNCYRALLDKYFRADGVVLKVYPMEMRYGGPKEAILHAIIRQNFGCSHLIIGRDHAGVGKYYGPFDAQAIFDDLKPNALEIQPLKLDWTFWCYKCGEMASMKTCPHGKEDRCLISGTELRRMLSEGEQPPAEFSRPEVLDILMEFYQSQS